jgi:exportin-T
MNQLITKYKQRIAPFLSDIFMPIVQVIMAHLDQPYHPSDEEALREHRNLQKCYFLFLNSLATNNVITVFESQSPAHIEQVLSTLIQGASSFPDPSTQKTCFSVLKKMVDTWGGGDKLPGFIPVVYKHVVPACFEAALNSEFDLNDAHSFLAIGEISGLLLSLIGQREGEFLLYMQNDYLPKLELPPELSQHLLQTLQLKDLRTMKNQLKIFFKQVRQNS